eukprot:174258-Rhodomonas_salina.1
MSCTGKRYEATRICYAMRCAVLREVTWGGSGWAGEGEAGALSPPGHVPSFSEGSCALLFWRRCCHYGGGAAISARSAAVSGGGAAVCGGGAAVYGGSAEVCVCVRAAEGAGAAAAEHRAPA